jgi:hypothetical protein
VMTVILTSYFSILQLRFINDGMYSSNFKYLIFSTFTVLSIGH